MKIIRESSYNEAIAFYQWRQIIKGLNTESDVIFKSFPPNFYINSINLILLGIDEFKKLVYLESVWTRREKLIIKNGLDYRLLEKVADRAINMRYIDSLNEEHPGYRMKTYYKKFLSTKMQFKCENRIIIRSLLDNEKFNNPSGKYYIHDGNGRCLPYMILIKEGKIKFNEVECYYFN